MPYCREIYKNFKIGSFINRLKKSKNNNLKNKIENIFNNQIEIKIHILSDKEKIKLCQEYYNEYKKIPKYQEIYKNFNIGYFINNMIYGKNKQIKNEIEKIFKCQLKKRKILLSDEEKINLCKEYYNINNTLPNHRKIYKNFNIGNFIVGLKQGSNKHLKKQVENIFNTKIIEYNK